MAVNIKVVKNVTSVATYQDAIRSTGHVLIDAEYVKPEYVEACINRESDFPTGLQLPDGIGVAIPHGDAELVKESSLSVLRIDAPVLFGLMEDREQKIPVSLVFHLALSSGGDHIKMLRKLMRFLQDDDFMTQCKQLNASKLEEYLFPKFND